MPSILVRVSRSKLVWVAVLIAVAGYFRVVAVDTTNVDTPLRADALDYYLSAYNLVHHGVYSRSRVTLTEPSVRPPADAYRAPGVPLLIAPFMGRWPAHGEIVRGVQDVNIVLGIGAVVAVFFAATIALPLSAAVGVGLLAACSPHLVSLTVYVLSETPAAFLIAALLAVCAMGVPASTSRRRAYFLALGLLVGLLAYFRPVFIAFAPLLALVHVERESRWQALILGTLGACAVLAPWLVRNALNVPPGESPSLLANTMLEGSYRGFVYAGDPSTFPYGAHADPRYATLRVSVGRTLDEILQKVASDPAGYFVWYWLQKPVYLFQWSNIDGAGDVFVYPVLATPFETNALFVGMHELFRYGHPLMLALAFAGAVAAWLPAATVSTHLRQRRVVRMASVLLTFAYVIHLPFVVSARYAVPFLPAIYLLAGFAVVVVVRVVRRRPATPEIAP